jgi:putative ABC transport system permease protein
MGWKLIIHSFLRDFRRKTVAISAVALATALATFLLHWSLSFGDKIQSELRAYGANIIVIPADELSAVQDPETETAIPSAQKYLRLEDVSKLERIFWRNQILAKSPLLREKVQYRDAEVYLVGAYVQDAVSIESFRKAAPYLSIQGNWPQNADEALAGIDYARKFGLKIGDSISLTYRGQPKVYKLTGIQKSGGDEDHEFLADLNSVQSFVQRPQRISRLLISAMVTPPNSLYYQYQRNPQSLSRKDLERYSCTPYAVSIARDIQEVIPNSEVRIVRRITQAEEKIAGKVNWLIGLVTLAALIAASLTTTSTTTGLILDRRKELALMKAIGSQNLFIATYILGEILLLGVIGSVLGFGAGSLFSLGLSRTIFKTGLELKWIVLPLVSLIGAVIVFCGSLWPLRLATRVEPAQALKDL